MLSATEFVVDKLIVVLSSLAYVLELDGRSTGDEESIEVMNPDDVPKDCTVAFPPIGCVQSEVELPDA